MTREQIATDEQIAELRHLLGDLEIAFETVTAEMVVTNEKIAAALTELRESSARSVAEL